MQNGIEEGMSEKTDEKSKNCRKRKENNLQAGDKERKTIGLG